MRPSHQELAITLDAAWEARSSLGPTACPPEVRVAVETVIDALDAGTLRVANKTAAGWEVHQWVKKAVLLSFRLTDNRAVQAGDLQFFDKVPTKFEGMSLEQMQALGIRVVPPAVARRGSFLARNVILMPSYVNIGAYFFTILTIIMIF